MGIVAIHVVAMVNVAVNSSFLPLIHTFINLSIHPLLGLLGDATEDMVETLDDGKGEDVNEEEVYKLASVLGKCNGLEAILLR